MNATFPVGGATGFLATLDTHSGPSTRTHRGISLAISLSNLGPCLSILVQVATPLGGIW